MIYGYIRVSTDTQTSKNQKLVIREYCKRKRLHHIQWVDETVSGTKKPEKRKLGKLLAEVKADDVVIVTELSRLGRSLIMIMNILQTFIDKGVKVKAIKEGFECDDTIVSKVLIFAFGLSAEIERQLLSERTKMGLARARKEGKQIGRLPGQRPTRYKLTPYKRKIKQWLLEGRSKLSIAKELHVQWTTLNTFIRRQKLL
ncbi:recombinase family protein [Treponema sp.]|uniref:recombinase family protein n=1 Tax=Treponema sp. TaxID=166 RepID=UPI0025F8AFE4|nr:recombinase family protein [Treponema sp.]MCR5219189.1 recombinase family protein [Treponema sp.]